MTQTASTQTRRPFPAVDEVFPLTAREEITGLRLGVFVRSQENWRRTVRTVGAGTTRYFTLMQHVGQELNLAAIVRACKAQGGKDTDGVWIKVFHEMFGHRPVNYVGVPDDSWVGEDGMYPSFPLITNNGILNFAYARNTRDDQWLWLVEVEEPAA